MTPTQFSTLINEIQNLQLICGLGFITVAIWNVIIWLKK